MNLKERILHARITRRLLHYAKHVYYMFQSPYFLKHLAGILVFLGIIIGGSLIWLNVYTHHGEKIEVPDFSGLKLEQARRLAQSKDIQLMVTDSTYIAEKPPGIVLRQNPRARAFVKEGRKIYLTVTKRQADLVTLPKLWGNTENYRQYAKKLQRLGIHSKIVKEVYDRRLMPGTILKVFYRSKDVSKKINKDMQVPVGATIGFIISKRGTTTVAVPDLRCVSKDDAEFLLEVAELRTGQVKRKASTNTAGLVVIAQKPKPGTKTARNSLVDITLGTKKEGHCQ